MPKACPQEFGDAVVRVVLVRGKSTGVTRFTKECRALRDKAGYLSQTKLSPEGAIYNVSGTSIRAR